LRDPTGRQIGTAPAVSDRSRNAWVYDVVVAQEWRRRKLGVALMRVLLEHPSMREVARITLRSTEAARGLYVRFGFSRSMSEGDDAIEMVRMR
jgi:ribosomal protein S18 acetylase RimI-like enzyme